MSLLLAVCLVALWCGQSAAPATAADDASRLAAVQKLYEQKNWEEAAKLALGPADQSSDLDYYAGMSLAHLQRWEEAAGCFSSGHRKAPGEARFLVERAGAWFKQKNNGAAKRDLRAALRLNPHDNYAREFLGTLCFVDGNIEAALKIWNPLNKPRLDRVAVSPQPRLKKELLERALTFHAPQVLSRKALRECDARLAALRTFPQRRYELVPEQNGNYSATIHASERNGFADSKLLGLMSFLSGVPYRTVYPEFYNMGGRAINVTSMGRWDPQKRRVEAGLSLPLFGNPSERLEIFFDARDEHWNLSRTFTGPGDALGNLNLRRLGGGVQIHRAVSGDWSWTAGLEVASREFRNAGTHTAPGELPFFTGSNSFAAWLEQRRTLMNLPEHRFTIDGSGAVRFGRFFSDVQGPFATVSGDLRAHWFPQAHGDDFETQIGLRAADTSGDVPLDELFQLGMVRDNDLLLRGHSGTTGGRKGTAPLGRRFVLLNAETDKSIYHHPLFHVKLGPFLDMGSIADDSQLFGSQRWLVDAGLQCKVTIFSRFAVVLSYGRDLRSGKGLFYETALH